jgi:hypothetical protein
MSHPVIVECIKSANSAVASFEERKEIEAEKFKESPTHYMSWGSPLIAMEYDTRIANHILYCPCSFPLSRALQEKRKQELSAQLMYHGAASSSAFHNATESFIVAARCNMLERGWLSEHYIASLAKAEGEEVADA